MSKSGSAKGLDTENVAGNINVQCLDDVQPMVDGSGRFICVACLIVALEILVDKTLTEVWDILVQAVAMLMVKLVILFQSQMSLLLKLLKASNHMPAFLGTIELLVTHRGQGRRHDIPCIFAAVVALLAEPKPQIDYTLKAVGGCLTAIPGLLDMIDDTVNSIITDMLQWPHRIVVPIGGIPVDTSELELKPVGKVTVTA